MNKTNYCYKIDKMMKFNTSNDNIWKIFDLKYKFMFNAFVNG